MIKLVTLAAIGLCAPSFAQQPQQPMGPDLDVRVEGGADRVRIQFRTVEDQNQVCPLIVQSLSVDSTARDAQGVVTAGHIEFIADVDPGAVCLFVVGKQQGAITFARGDQLPALAPGQYDLVINDVSYGTLEITREGVRLTEAGGAA